MYYLLHSWLLTLPNPPGGSRKLVFFDKSLRYLGLSRISHRFLKDNPKNNFMQTFLSISLSFRMKYVLYLTHALFQQHCWNIIFCWSRNPEMVAPRGITKQPNILLDSNFDKVATMWIFHIPYVLLESYFSFKRNLLPGKLCLRVF